MLQLPDGDGIYLGLNMDQSHQVEVMLRQIPDWADRPVEIEQAVPVLASPSWRGVDGTPLIVRDRERGESLFVKCLHPDTAFYINPAEAFVAAKLAGDVGVGPRVVLADAASGILCTEHLGAGWRVACHEMTADTSFVDRVLEVRAQMAACTPLPRNIDVFKEILKFHDRLLAIKGTAPPDMSWLVETVMMAADRARDADEKLVPIHGDGNLSNILVGAGGEIRLVDFDRAGMGSPCEEIGSALVEMCTFESDARSAFFRTALRAWPGTAAADAERAFDRSRLFGIADDLRWALIAMILARESPRRIEHEFYKFGLWRLLRARIAIRDPSFGAKLRVQA